MGIKLIIKSIADIFTSGPNFKYNKCKDAGEGIFGFRRNRDESGKLKPGADDNVYGRVCVQPCNYKLNFDDSVPSTTTIYSPWN